MTKSKQVYPTDLNDTQWLKIQPYLLAEAQTGRPREHSWRIILNSIFYILQSGCSWRMLSHDLPPWQTVYHYFRLWRKEGLLGRRNFWLEIRNRKKVRRSGRISDSSPTLCSRAHLRMVGSSASKSEDQVGFQILPRRCVVERTFGWLVRQRRLARDYERLVETSEAFIYTAMIRLMIRTLDKP